MKKILFVLFTVFYISLCVIFFRILENTLKDQSFERMENEHQAAVSRILNYIDRLSLTCDTIFEQYKSIKPGESREFGDSSIFCFPLPSDPDENRAVQYSFLFGKLLHMQKIYQGDSGFVGVRIKMDSNFFPYYTVLNSEDKIFPANTLLKKPGDLKKGVNRAENGVFFKSESNYGVSVISVFANDVITAQIQVLKKFRMFIGAGLYILSCVFFLFLGIANAKTEQANKRLAFLVVQTAHEMKNPLSIIIAFCEQIISGKIIQEKQGEYVEKIFRSAVTLQTIVENSLNVSKNGDSLNCESVNLREFIEENIRFGLKAEFEGNDFMICADPEKLRQIIDNLSCNAFKYARDAEKGIRVSSAEKITLCVHDSGEGVSKNDSRFLFQKGYRGANSGKIQGSGLGLSIVKKYVDMHGWKCFFETEPGTGFSFYIVMERCRHDNN